MEALLSSGNMVIPFSRTSTRPSIVLSSSSPPSSLSIDLIVSYQRKELNLILAYYGAMVAKGEWRDYAIDSGSHEAIFSIFRHCSEQPLYSVVKEPKLANKQGAYRVVASDGQVLKRGKELKNVLKIFDKKLELISS